MLVLKAGICAVPVLNAGICAVPVLNAGICAVSLNLCGAFPGLPP